MAIRIRTQRRWRKVVEAQQSSSLSPGQYCSKENICPTSFYAWRKRLGMKQEVPTTALPDSEDSGPGQSSKGFMRIKPPGTAALGGIRIEIPNGWCVQTDYRGEDGLKRLLEILRCL